MPRVGRPPSCTCGTCAKCKANRRQREKYQAKTVEERRAWVARRDRERVKSNDRASYYRNWEQRRSERGAYARENPEAMQRAKDEWAARNPEKRAAHTAVAAAIRAGRLDRQSCEVCGAKELVHAHHDDYARPLDVRWLCPEHHALAHFVC